MVSAMAGGCGKSDIQIREATSRARLARFELIKQNSNKVESLPDVPNVSSDPTEGAFEFVWRNEHAICRGYSDKRVITYLNIDEKVIVSSQSY